MLYSLLAQFVHTILLGIQSLVIVPGLCVSEASEAYARNEERTHLVISV